MSGVPSFAELASAPDAALDVLTLALAAEFRDVDAARAVARLDVLGAELAHATERTDGDAVAQAFACRQLLGVAQGFAGDRKHYDHPDNSMLDVVLTRRRGLPILLSVVYVEVARRWDGARWRRLARPLRGRPLRRRPSAAARSLRRRQNHHNRRRAGLAAPVART